MIQKIINMFEHFKEVTHFILLDDANENLEYKEERLNHAIELQKDGFVRYIIITGGYGKKAQNSDSWIAKQYVLEMGVPESAIYIEENSKKTKENLYYAKKIMDSHNMHTALVVSDPIHMKRAMLIAKDCKMTAYPSPTPTSMYRSVRTKISFLNKEILYYLGYDIERIFTKKN